MAVLQIEFDISRVKVLNDYLLGMEDRVEDFSVPLTSGAQWMLADVKEAIATGGSSWGDTWAPHAEATNVRWGVHPLMDNVRRDYNGGLIDDLHYFVRPKVAGVFTRNPVLRLHEHGTKAPDGEPKNPARAVLAFKSETIDRIVDLCLDYAIEENTR